MKIKQAKYDSHIAFRQWAERDEPSFLEMLNSVFQPEIPFMEFEMPRWDYSFLFLAKGVFSDVLVIYAQDAMGTTYYIEWTYWELHWGMDNVQITLYDTYEQKWQELKEKGVKNVIYLALSPFEIENKRKNNFYFQGNYVHPKTDLATKLFIIDIPAALSYQQEGNAIIEWVGIFENIKKESFTVAQKKAKEMLLISDWHKEAKFQYFEHKERNIEQNKRQLNRYQLEGYEIDERYTKPPYPPIVMGVSKLEYDMGVRRQLKNSTNEVNLSLLTPFIEKMTFTLFREWTSQVKESFPQKDITIIDERCLVNEVTKILKGAIIDLFQSELYQTTAFEEKKWSKIGTILGFIKGRLGVCWYNEYFVKSETIYKQYAALKAMIAFLEFDKIAEIRLDKLYEAFLQTDTNLAEIELEVNKEILGEKNSRISSPEKGKMRVLLQNLMLETVLKMYENKLPPIKLSLDTFLTDELIWQWIRENEEDSTLDYI